MYQCNVEGTLSVMQAALDSGCKRVRLCAGFCLLIVFQVVYASSSGVVGCSLDQSFVATDASPYCEHVVAGWPYYAGKIEAERLARSIRRAPWWRSLISSVQGLC